MTMNPFDFVNDLSYNKKDLIKNSEDAEQMEKEYNPYLINKAFSYFMDTVLHANEMNRAVIDKKLQHDYYLHAISKRKRFSKWYKPQTDDLVKLVSEAYNINTVRAKEYLALMSPDDIVMLKEIMNNGGKEK